MKKIFLRIFWVCMTMSTLNAVESFPKGETTKVDAIETPKYLYKILSVRDWQDSQNKENVVLSADDAAFIHLSTESQLDRIITKYWSEAPQVVVLELDTAELQGDLVLEANPGG